MKSGLVLEDQATLAGWLRETLEECFPGIRVTHADTLAAALRHVEQEVPDIALVDLGLPDGSGLDLIRALSARPSACEIVVTTIYADDHHLFPALRAGANGYLLKDQPRAKTVQALRGIANGEPPLSASIARRLLRVFSGEATDTRSEALKLSPRESETLVLIAKGYKIAEVAATLGVSAHTAHEYVKGVYRKLKVGSRAEATLEAARRGLVNPHA
ncbi:response regulator transcription factor [Thermomonas brevis]|uniref:Response regulator transcription factor n=1 Tax=Thermomonas brevis TaxID=215691 RepID=A0A7G9QVH8_9GAMM|nr:response regulator transcription factor [Thermomonas brevis]QNN47353.1 response regulator transcription factor [Thermomonas brevis]